MDKSNSNFMTMTDAYNPYATLELISEVGVKKSKQRFDHIIVKSVLAGVFLSCGGLFSLIVGGGGTPLAENLGSGIQQLVRTAVSPIGLILIIMTGAELFTSNTMVLTVSTLHRKTTFLELIVSWVTSYGGNFIGCLFYEAIFVYYADLLSQDPYRLYVITIAETKGNTVWYQMFLRGIAGNWFVCLAKWFALSGRDLHSKIIGIYLPAWLFVAVGYEHCIANMFSVQIGMMLGANLSIRKYIKAVMIPVALGNIIGGALFGFTYWYLYIPKKTANTDLINPSKSKIKNVLHMVERRRGINRSEQDLDMNYSF